MRTERTREGLNFSKSHDDERRGRPAHLYRELCGINNAWTDRPAGPGLLLKGRQTNPPEYAPPASLPLPQKKAHPRADSRTDGWNRWSVIGPPGCRRVSSSSSLSSNRACLGLNLCSFLFSRVCYPLFSSFLSRHRKGRTKQEAKTRRKNGKKKKKKRNERRKSK